MKYAEVAVGAPGGHRHTFTYSIPVPMAIEVGHCVTVPFGPSNAPGVVLGVSDSSAVADTRDVVGINYPGFRLWPERIMLAAWISGHYRCPIFDACALMLPPGLGRGRVVRPRHVKYVVLADISGQEPVGSSLRPRVSTGQEAVLQFLRRVGRPVTQGEVAREVGCSRTVIDVLVRKGLVLLYEGAAVDGKGVPDGLPLEFPFPFTQHQLKVWLPIRAAIAHGNGEIRPRPFLLHGITGSGKTEVYLQALAETVRLGRKGICLVPEIALTGQMFSRFVARYPGRVGRLHSSMSFAERYAEWMKIYSGQYDVVIGPRSAIFAPQPDLGLIVVDEEHEQAYKESDRMPRYHAREVAVQLASRTGSVLVLGSATPDVESYYRAQCGEYRLLELTQRASWQGMPELPQVTVVDMKGELRSGVRGIFSRLLLEKIAKALGRGEQVILYINRRGAASFAECRQCGYVLSCRRCSGVLVYHSSEKRLVCHHCRRTYPVVTSCPECKGKDIAFRGIGTETVESACRKLFDHAKVARFDSDAVSSESDYKRIIAGFQGKKIDILVGTQLLAKGFDFPGVSLVGVISADTGLALPDFRAGERVFQLLCQVSGRAGRGFFAGTAVIQTYSPGTYAVRCAASHDYRQFYNSEMRYRREFGYPPLADMARLVFRHANQEKCYLQAGRMVERLQRQVAAKGLSGLRVIGPAPAMVTKLRGRYQVQVIVLGRGLPELLDGVDFPSGINVDVDPVGVI